ncbi:hypothetical protein SAMN05216339_10510 [Nitrosomonas eutropha]|uniref:Lipoprotein n=1 Tax=Nitrosomonas eutropha TaxID=916 RepID=A0A1I7HGU8_9PROT|nr:hypothetical protein [Nitrosomonas eutropha]SFU59881.1 hypothetical protein SAMN05216339_10510 [Nitrosomonas eutropha]
MKIYQAITICTSIITVSGCFNLPTQSSQITGTYVSGLKYEEFGCGRLTAEVDSLARRESQLVIAQDQRLKSSKVQAFWLGYGQGDDIEARSSRMSAVSARR